MNDTQRQDFEASREVICPSCSNSVDPEARFCAKCGLGMPRGAGQIDAFVEKLLDQKLKDRLKDQNVVANDVFERISDRAIKWARHFAWIFGGIVTAITIFMSLFGFSLSQKISDQYKQASNAVESLKKEALDDQTKLQSSLRAAEDKLRSSQQAAEAKLQSSQRAVEEIGKNVEEYSKNAAVLSKNVSSGMQQSEQLSQQYALVQNELNEIQTKIKSDLQAKIDFVDSLLRRVTRQQEALQELTFKDVLPRYIKYLEMINFLHLSQTVNVVPYSNEAPPPKDVGPSNVLNAMYRDKNLYIHKDLLADQSIAVREYTECALQRTLGKLSCGSAASEIESALADYFSASFFDDPRIGGSVAANNLHLTTPYIRTLDNDEKGNAKKRPAQAGDTERGEVWGRAFWECRKELERDIVDRILFQAWTKAAPLSNSADALKGFSRSVVELSRGNRDERSAKCFTLQFQRRDLPL
jgi:hypothetical protein